MKCRRHCRSDTPGVAHTDRLRGPRRHPVHLRGIRGRLQAHQGSG